MVTSGMTDLTTTTNILLSACVCMFLRIWQQAAIISRHRIDVIVIIKEKESVYFAVRAGCLSIVQVNVSHAALTSISFTE